MKVVWWDSGSVAKSAEMMDSYWVSNAVDS